MDDRDVAGKHVGQVLEHPQGLQVVHAPAATFGGAPGLHVEPIGRDAPGHGSAAGAGRCERLREFERFRRDQARADLATQPRLRIGRREVGRVALVVRARREARVGHRKAGRGDRKLGITRHHLHGLAISLRDMVLGGEVADLGADAAGEGLGRDAREGTHAAATREQTIPHGRGTKAKPGDRPKTRDDNTPISHRGESL